MPLFEVLGAKNAFLKRLEKLGIKTVEDLLRHFPFRYEDFSRISKVVDLAPGEDATVQGTVSEVRMKNAWRRGIPVTEAVIEDETGAVRAVWFNQPYIANVIRAGRTANFSGKLSISQEGELYFNNPAHEVLRTDEDGVTAATKHTGRLVSIYPETKGLTSRGLRFIIAGIMKRPIAVTEWLPQDILEANGFPELSNAFGTVHFPDSLEDADVARRRFLFEDLFLLQLVNLLEKSNLAEKSAPAIPEQVDRVRDILAKLPFELTPSQKKSLWEIMQDMARPHPMNRLLQGDVGSGKTIVAALAAMMAAEAGFQTAFMAPTEILASQHFATFRKFMKNVSPDRQAVSGLITASGATILYEDDMMGTLKKDEFWKKSAKGEISVIFGTHALLQKSASFKKLGLVIVDEQHRFGVRQRQALLTLTESKTPKGPGAKSKASSGFSPHFLSMSATPIPRTLMMTVFGDLDVSLITELPAGRKPIETKVVLPQDRTATYEFIRQQIKEGRQAFVICPRIEESEKEGTKGKKPSPMDDTKMVTEEYERLSKKIFPDLHVAMLHGKMKPKEKEETMARFKDGKTDVLVSTSVIEVGVDVPNATIMMIENADRFGLAQLYQFRGRVGRGEHASYCLLFTDVDGATAKSRLNAIVTAKNGFELAEKDLALRGPGQFFGEAQSGFEDTVIDALRDPELVKISRDAAIHTVKSDPTLHTYPPLRERLIAFQRKIHQE